MIFIVIFMIYLFISCFTYGDYLSTETFFLCALALFKWIFDYRKCTVSYIECKIRNIKKERSSIYYVLEDITDLNKSKYKLYFYFFTLIVLFVHTYKILFIN